MQVAFSTRSMAASVGVGLKRVCPLEKFYTTDNVAARCVRGLLEVMPQVQGYSWLEPSAGDGAFVRAVREHDALQDVELHAIDVSPADAAIEVGDFFKWSRPLNAGKLVVYGNPPFGRQSKLAGAFIRHACDTLAADVVAFILPRSFKKPSMQKRVPRNYHLRHELDLSDCGFKIGGLEHVVSCVFQVWERGESEREMPTCSEPAGFRFVKGDADHDMTIRRVGHLAGQASCDATRPNSNTHYFIRFDGDHDVHDLADRLCAYSYADHTTGPKSISKSEVCEAIAVVCRV